MESETSPVADNAHAAPSDVPPPAPLLVVPTLGGVVASLHMTAVTAGAKGPSAASGGAKKRKFAHTNEAQRKCMLEWLEQPGNFQLLTSPSGATLVRSANGKKIKKTDGFRALMRHVNAKTQANWTMEITKSRYESLLTSYRKVKQQAQEGGLALTENDLARGITDTSQKLNALCVFYDRIDALFDPKPRVIGPEDEPGTAPVSAIEVGGKQSDHANSKEDQAAVAPLARDAPVAVAKDVADKEDGAGSTNGGHHPRKRVKPTESLVAPSTISIGDASTLSSSSPSLNGDPSSEVVPMQLAVERERLELLAAELAAQKRELDLREQDLQQREDRLHLTLTSELADKMRDAGKSPTEINELLVFLAAK